MRADLPLKMRGERNGKNEELEKGQGGAEAESETSHLLFSKRAPTQHALCSSTTPNQSTTLFETVASL